MKKKDHHAFTEIYNRYSVLKFYKVNQMLRDEEVSKDFIQDLFVSIWDKSGKTNLIDPVSPKS
ncbi:hypothetical protein [Pedobacter psychrodurus]|uniref:hypothetical protein n=1 Tax=Pedobacter psychrodurus TaxID=2530456 RepID=UPI00292E8450|nr:hypothetical protein [Pedobacter psychrodurus]